MGYWFHPIAAVLRAMSLAVEYRMESEAIEYNRDYIGRGVEQAVV